MAIVPTAKAPKDKGYFRSYAVLCHMNSRKIKKFETLQIFVFKSSDFAFRFRQYQNKRNGAILTEKDYRQLTHLWKDVPVFYVFIGKGATGEKSAFYYPQDKPSSWWKPLVQKPKTKTATTQ